MITRIVIESYRCFETFDVEPNPGMNILSGPNESGKSTLLEAIALALTGKVNGRWVQEELNPFWFNRRQVRAFFERLSTDDPIAAPEILVELYMSGSEDAFQPLRGVYNSHGEDCPGTSLRIAPSEQYADEFKAYLSSDPPTILPVEFYDVDWRAFSDDPLTQRPKALATSFIDSRTIRSTSGVDYHTKEMLSEHLDAKERAELSLAHRRSKQEITDKTLAGINSRIAAANSALHDRKIGLQMDQSSRTSWETGIVPQVEDIPFAMSGQGQQATIKVALAMSRTVGASTFLLVEEPENHLSHTSLTRMIARVEELAAEDQQLFVATHSSYVANRLRLDKLLLLHAGTPGRLRELSPETVAYFRKLADYDTLRLVLADKLALVEGPSDAIVLERAFKDATGKLPSEAGIDVVSMDGLSFRRALEVCARLDRRVVVLQDNDGRPREEVRASAETLLAEGTRELLVSDCEDGPTLEPQLISSNGDDLLRRVLGVTPRAELNTWMANNKTEAALRIFDHDESLTYPAYIRRAVALLR